MNQILNFFPFRNLFRGMEIGGTDGYFFNESPCYSIEDSPLLGRHLVAAKDIKKGEVILTDLPLVTGPIKATVLLCPGCYQAPSSDIKCKKCGSPMCSLECPSVNRHDQAECSFLREKNEEKVDLVNRDWNKLADCLMVIRCLLLKQQDERKWKRLMEMESNWEKWKESPLYPSATKLEEIIRTEYNLSQDQFSTREILEVQAILDINAFEVRLPDANIQAAYTKASLAEHNCLPNTLKTFCSKTLQLTLRAARDIPQGSHITTTYCDILWPTWHRQQYLQWSKFFICSCERCHSETECESHLASLVCMDCFSHQQQNVNESGTTCVPYAAPIIPQDTTWETITKDYLCSSCHIKIPARDSYLTSKKADDSLSELDKYASFETISTYERWLQEWTLINQILPESLVNTCAVDTDDAIYEDEKESTSDERQTHANITPRLLLHPQHSLVLDACHTLFLLYPRDDCDHAQLKRKECFGTHLLKATKPLTGISKFRGTISYELAMTKATIFVNQLESNGMTDNLQQLAEEVLQLLGESQELLKYEPVDQPEGKLAQTGASQLEQLTLFFSELFSVSY